MIDESYHPALRGAGHRPTDLPVLHHSGAQHHAQEFDRIVQAAVKIVLEPVFEADMFPSRAFDAGLRRRAFPPDAASLLPG